MFGAIIALVVMVIVRILFGYLATMYDFLVKFVPWITGLTVAVAVVAAILIVIRIVKEVRK